jgi:hypothetical protein
MLHKTLSLSICAVLLALFAFSFTGEALAQYILIPTDTMGISSVDTLCSGWSICVTNHHSGRGIKSAVLLNDSLGEIVPPPTGHKPYVYVNCSFDLAIDPNNSGEIIFSGYDTTVCFRVNITDISKDAYAPIYMADTSGNPKLFEFSYKGVPAVISPEVNSNVNFGLQYLHKPYDSVFYLMNQKKSQLTFQVSQIELSKKNNGFAIVSVKPPLPALIKPGDTLLYRVRFIATDTLRYNDTVTLKTDCFNSVYPVYGQGGTGLIAASDIDFGRKLLGGRTCVDTITVSNIGTMSFTLNNNYKLNDNVHFMIDSTYPQPAGLPVEIPPGKKVKVRLCYMPTHEGLDTTRIVWGTDIQPPYDSLTKNFSLLMGRGIKPGIDWDKDSLEFASVSDTEVVRRIWLDNSGSAPSHVGNVEIVGPDASDFRIVAWQLNLPNYDFYIDTGSAYWFDIGFKPDLSKPYPLRIGYLVAHLFSDTVNTVSVLDGWANTLKVANYISSKQFTIHPNPVSGGSIIVDLTLTKPEQIDIEIFDVLGREVMYLGSKMFSSGKQTIELALQALSPGVYYVRLPSEEGILTKKLQILPR